MFKVGDVCAPLWICITASDKDKPLNEKMVHLLGLEFCPVTLVLVMLVALHAQGDAKIG